MKDYFNILGLQPNANEDEIRQAYKRLAMKHHPDRGGDQSQFQEVQEAHSVLTDPQKRQQWEQQRAFGQAHHHPGGFGFHFNFGPDINDVMNQFHSGAFFGQGFHRPQRNRDLRIHLDLDLASTLSTQQKTIEIKHQDGTTNTVQINIPRGVQNGLQMRLSGHGDHSNKSVGPGDLYIDFRITDSHGFIVNNINLSKKLELNSVDAILGTNVTIQGLDGRQFNLVIPPGTQHATQFRFAGQGLYDINQPIRGDLFFEIALVTPSKLSQQQLDSLKKYI